jgi:adenylosuccinate lyase
MDSCVSAYENVALWHERDISHSSVERVIIPDATTILHYSLHRFASILTNLVVYKDTMLKNMDRTYGLYNSQRLLIKLIDKGLSREAAYDLVQPQAMRAWSEGKSFKELVLEQTSITQHLDEEEINEAFDARYHLRRIDYIFERVGLG